MTFLKCSIRGVKHGEIGTEDPLMEQEVVSGKITAAASPAEGAIEPQSSIQKVHILCMYMIWYTVCNSSSTPTRDLSRIYMREVILCKPEALRNITERIRKIPARRRATGSLYPGYA